MAYKSKTEQWLYNQNRPNSRLQFLVPTPAQYKKMKPEIRRKYQSIAKRWKSNSPTQKANALDDIFKVGNHGWQDKSTISGRRLAYGYSNVETASLADTRRVNEAELSEPSKVHTQRGGAYSGKTQNEVKRYMSFMKAEKGMLYAEPTAVRDVVETFDVYSDETGNWWIVTDRRLKAKNGSPSGRSINVVSKAQYPTEQQIYDRLKAENAEYNAIEDEFSAKMGIDSMTGF